METINEDSLPSTSTSGRTAPKKTRGKPSSYRRMDAFLDKKNADTAMKRRSTLSSPQEDALMAAYDNYKAQMQHGSETRTQIPVTTRGIGFLCLQMAQQGTDHLPRTEQPPKADVNELYRYSLTQLGRQMSICEPGPTHTRADVIPTREKVSAFSAHQNGVAIADAINQFGNFEYKDRKFTTYVPDLQLETEEVVEVEPDPPVTYSPKSPDPTISPVKRAKRVGSIKRSIPSPYTLTIFNLRTAVEALADERTPLGLRNQFIKRNPIPGAIFENGLLTNPNDIMPCDYRRYMQNTFLKDVNKCTAFFSQMSQAHQGSIGRVAMDGRGNELNLASSMTLAKHDFFINNHDFHVSDETYFFATDSLNNISKLRAYVNLMNEAPLIEGGTEPSSRFGIRDPNSSQHTMVEFWTSLAWNVSVFRSRVA